MSPEVRTTEPRVISPKATSELLDPALVQSIERFSQLVDEFVDLANAPNPFQEAHIGSEDSLLGPEVKEASDVVMDIAARAHSVQIENSEEACKTLREKSPILRKSAEDHVAFLAEAEKSLPEKYKAAFHKLDIAPEDFDLTPEEYAELIASVMEDMRKVADDVPTTILEEFKAVTESENSALVTDGSLSYIAKNPFAGNALKSLLEKKTDDKQKVQLKQDDGSLVDYDELRESTAIVGMDLRKVKKAHRSPAAIKTDLKLAEIYERSFGKLTEIFSKSYEDVRGTATDNANHFLQILAKRIQTLRDDLGTRLDSAELSDAEIQQAAKAAEEYVAVKAEQVLSMVRQNDALNIDGKDKIALEQIRKRKLPTLFKRLSRQAVEKTVNTYENVAADKEFRAQVRTTKDILAGGGRIDHPHARQLNRDLHQLSQATFGSKKTKLAPNEYGLLVALATGTVDDLLAVVDRFEASAETTDPQIEKLKYDLPEQFEAITNYNIDAVLSKLLALMGDDNDRLVLINAMQSTMTEKQLKQAVDRVWRIRNNIPEEPEVEEPEPEEIILEEAPEEEPELELEVLEDPILEIRPELIGIAEQLEWVVFPTGAKLIDIQQSMSSPDMDLRRVNWDRISHLLELVNSTEGRIYRSREAKLGTNVPYLVAEINVYGRKFAVAECPEVGNATYIVDEASSAGSWQEMMRLSKAEARSLGARRIIHPQEARHLAKIIDTIQSLATVMV